MEFGVDRVLTSDILTTSSKNHDAFYRTQDDVSKETSTRKEMITAKTNRHRKISLRLDSRNSMSVIALESDEIQGTFSLVKGSSLSIT